VDTTTETKTEEARIVLKGLEDGKYIVNVGKVSDELTPGFYKYDQKGANGLVYIKQSVAPDRLVLDLDQQRVVNKVLAFFGERELYQKMDIRHRRGIFMYGDPGTGKTTIIKAIMMMVIARGGIVLNMSHTFRELPVAIKMARKNTDTPILVVSEDIETLLAGNNGGASSMREMLNMQKATSRDRELTEVMDGLNGREMDNVLFLATTNFIDKIPGRLKNRPGRFDERIEIGYPSSESRAQIVSDVGHGFIEEGQVEFLAEISEKMTVAHIRELVIQSVIYKTPEKELRTMADELRVFCAESAREMRGEE
jgi:SpoVK/Ycf46/Vps4 family AAA+-type ATPase